MPDAIRNTFLATAMLLCLTALSLGAELWEELPQDKTKAVHDFAGLINSSDKAALESLARGTWNSQKAALVVVTVKSLEGGQIDDFANRLYEKWGIGDADKDQGVLFLVAKDDRKMRIEVGYGLEGTITDARAKSLIQNVAAPAFRSGNYSKGIRQVMQNLDAMIKGDYNPVAKSSKPANTGNSRSSKKDNGNLLIILLFVGFFALSGIINKLNGRPFFYSSPRRRGHYHGGSSWRGGGFGGGGGGGFGGFGGGMSGGGGASGGW